MKRLTLFLLVLTSCSSNPTINGVKYEKDETLSTSGDKSQPNWADETTPFRISEGKVYSVGVVTIRGDERPEAGARISENSARANIAKAVSNRMEFVFQDSEENSSFDSNQAKYIGSEVSSLTSHSMMPEGHWWRRYAQTDESGRHIYYKIYSLITMPEGDLKKAIYDAVNGMPDHKISDTFRNQVDKQWDRFVEGKKGEDKPDITKTVEVTAQKDVE